MHRFLLPFCMSPTSLDTVQHSKPDLSTKLPRLDAFYIMGLFSSEKNKKPSPQAPPPPKAQSIVPTKPASVAPKGPTISPRPPTVVATPASVVSAHTLTPAKAASVAAWASASAVGNPATPSISPSESISSIRIYLFHRKPCVQASDPAEDSDRSSHLSPSGTSYVRT